MDGYKNKSEISTILIGFLEHKLFFTVYYL